MGHGNIMKYCRRQGLTSEQYKMLDDGNQDFRVHDESVNEMDSYLLDGINSIVGQNDTLYHLGDFCFGPKHDYYNVAKRYRDRIACRNVHLIWGNHDGFSIRPLFTSAMDMNTASVDKQSIVLCHYCLATWNKAHRGVWHFYGHSHTNLEEWANKAMPGRRSMDVGVDNAFKILGEYRPFSFNELKEIMDKKSGFFPDHHEER